MLKVLLVKLMSTRIWLTQPQDHIARVASQKLMCHASVAQDPESLKPSLLARTDWMIANQPALSWESCLWESPVPAKGGLGRVISVVGVGWTAGWRTHLH